MDKDTNNKLIIMKNLFLTLTFGLMSLTAMAQMPSVDIEDHKGNTINTSELLAEKKPLIISFWSTICKPCIRELDAINDVLPDWLDEADFKVVAVSTDDSRFTTKARSLVEGHGWYDFICVYDTNQEFMRAMNVSITPQVFVVDGTGKIVYAHTGYTPGSEEELLEVIKGLK